MASSHSILNNHFLFLLFVLFIYSGCADNKHFENADLLIIKGGKFLMGNTSGSGIADELPVHTVQVDDFYMSKYELTFEQYDLFCAETGKNTAFDEGWGRGNMPIINVNFYDAAAYCNWLSIQHGLDPCFSGSSIYIKCDFSKNGYRLPTEAEWEYAARAGLNGSISLFSGTAVQEKLHIFANYADSASGFTWADQDFDDGYAYTAPVGSYLPNAFGLYDLSGNVWEWCWDWYDRNYYHVSPENNPRGPEIVPSRPHRIERGGSWNFLPEYMYVFSRRDHDVLDRRDNIGFRLVRSK